MQHAEDKKVPQQPVGDDLARFTVPNPLKIVQLLRGLIKRKELVSAFFRGGEELMLTAVLDVNPDQNTVTLDCGTDMEMNQRLVQAGSARFVTALDRVKIQFAGSEIRLGVFEGRPAFVMPIPRKVLWLQRRESYRLETPVANPLKCRIPLADNPELEVTIIDISAEGVGLLILDATALQTETGSLHPGCRIELPDAGTLHVTLDIRNSFEVTLKNGSKAMRCGCQFVDLPASQQSVLHRYIVRLERERIARTRGC